MGLESRVFRFFASQADKKQAQNNFGKYCSAEVLPHNLWFGPHWKGQSEEFTENFKIAISFKVI